MSQHIATTVTSKQVCGDVLSLLNKLKCSMLQIGENLGVTHIQLFALYSIHKMGSLPMGQFADVLHCDPSNVTGIVDRMVAQGLVIRQESPKDRRRKILILTDKGKKIVAALEDALPGYMGCEKLNSTDLLHLHDLLQKVVVTA